MLNFRKMRKDFPPQTLKEGKIKFEEKVVQSVKIVTLSSESVRVACTVEGNFENAYQSEIEIDRRESEILDSSCACPVKYDCHHLAAATFHLEKHLDKLLVAYSAEASSIEETLDASVKKTLEEAATKEQIRKGKEREKEEVEEYKHAATLLCTSPFFTTDHNISEEHAEIYFLIDLEQKGPPGTVAIQLGLKLPHRSRPQLIHDLHQFFAAIRYSESYTVVGGGHVSIHSFTSLSQEHIKRVMNVCSSLGEMDNPIRTFFLDQEILGTLLASAQESQLKQTRFLPFICLASFDRPLPASNQNAAIRFELEYFEAPEPKILLNPTLVIDEKRVPLTEEMWIFSCAAPGILYDGVFRRFDPLITRKHLCHLKEIQKMTIPESLFGSFIENALPELLKFSQVSNQDLLNQFVTLPFAGELQGVCDLTYFDGELEAKLRFNYGEIFVPVIEETDHTEIFAPFLSNAGILARNVVKEKILVDRLFKDFSLDVSQRVFRLKSEKKMIEFMTELLPEFQSQIQFNCPDNLLEQFIYDETKFSLQLFEGEFIDQYLVDLTVDGFLSGTTTDLLWDCIATRKNYIELFKGQKILILDLDRLEPLVQAFDELGLTKLDTHKEARPLWSLVSLDEKEFKKLPIDFSMSRKLKQIQKQMVSGVPESVEVLPEGISAELRDYQKQGVGWLERLRRMHLCGILADDMGLGKTLQAIVALTQFIEQNSKVASIVVCPTSLIYNWMEEIEKFSPQLKIICIDGTPEQRKKLINKISKYHVAVTSYSLLQKDIEVYQKVDFGYVILDEGQHIKNRSTRNAKSVKMLRGAHRLILTGTPIENSLNELWSLFDFLMPGLLSTYERFTDKYLKGNIPQEEGALTKLRTKLSPFILRRLKKDVLAELPPVREITYHCQLTERQKELYKSYAEAARQELTQLVEREGFEKVQIHVLATLTRLKQICCHPAIFAKDHPEEGDSAKYEMLLELIQNLVEGGHKTVIFSQYTQMLGIMRKELQKLGILFEYLDGSSKNRLSIVKKFNEADHIPIFLVSLKAGGTGLNLVGADTVIHYDLWWNPAVESQATDRVHRIGQNNSVCSYRLVTRGTIEEKIVELLEGKKELTKQIINTQEEAISKMLTWQDVLKLLQT